MFVIIVYDVSVERVAKICQFLRQYLNWIQNSVFEGELTESELIRVENGINDIIDKEKDSVAVYTLQSEKLIKKRFIGVKKTELSPIV